jgi:3-isopropylmalate/(R)-2-methylmalate dehydratase small subunit
MTTASKIIRGTVYVLTDNIDTDQIIPAEFLNLVPTIPAEYAALGSHALAGMPDDAEPFIPAGATTTPHRVIVAGRNFGCGSSREHAPIALGAAGIQAVVAQSYARIFFRNAVATGEVFPLESSERLCDAFATGDTVTVDLAACTIVNETRRASHTLKPIGAVAPVIEAGGIFNYARATGMISKRR